MMPSLVYILKPSHLYVKTIFIPIGFCFQRVYARETCVIDSLYSIEIVYGAEIKCDQM